MEEVPRILVVDDEQGMREGCRRVLTSEGYGVETAEDGLQGLELFERERNFAAAVVDIKMPRMDGIELIQRIHGIDEDAVLLVITAYSTIDSAVEATKRGAYGYVPKPFTPDELLLQVRNGLEKRALRLEAKRLKAERERRLLELSREKSKSGTILRCMTDCVLVVNREGQVVLHNDAAARVMPECASLSLPYPVGALKCAELRTLIEQALQPDGETCITSSEVHLGNGTYMASTSPLREQEGTPSGAVTVIRDITELKRLEAAKSMFVSMVAHEIKGPLAVTESYLSIILSGLAKGNPEKERSMLERSLLRIKTLRKMVLELMNITAMETGNFTIRRTPVDLGEVAKEAVESCREQAEAKKISIAFESAGGVEIEKALADRDTMSIAFANLVDNAVKYTPGEGHVTVSVSQSGFYTQVSVKDDGIGMGPLEKEKVFEEFYRARNKFTEDIPGTGLGLSLVKRIVEMHQGTIELETEQAKGSTFTVKIPLAREKSS